MSCKHEYDFKDENSLSISRCMNPLVEEVYSKQMIPLPNGNWAPMNVYIPREQGDYLYSLVRSIKPLLTCEIGMANGLSSLFIAQALKDNGVGRHIAIDPFQQSEWKNAGLALLEMAGLGTMVELIEKPSHQALPLIEEQGCRAQFIFVDGSHLFDYVISDFLCSDKILDVGGLLAFDDSDWPSIDAALRFIIRNRRYAAPFPDVSIEGTHYQPSFAGLILRKLGLVFPRLGSKLSASFLNPSFTLGLRGRCVVLRKIGEDDRNSQSRRHHQF